jgi:hypothetical protein
MKLECSVEPTKRALTTAISFWGIVELLQDQDDSWQSEKNVHVACYALAKYLIHHGGYFRLADSLEYLARDVTTKLKEAE